MKKKFTAVIVTALVWCMVMTSPAWAQTVTDLKIGDADGDGKSDINDALAVALYDCGMKIQNDMTGFTMADADCNGKVDIFDALRIAEFDSGILQTLECPECVQPSVPGGLGAVETEDMTSVSISWNAVPWAESYRLFRDVSSEGSFTEEIYAGSDTSYNDSADSECGINCYYRVLAENACGQSAKSDYTSVESYSACYNLPAPYGLKASEGTGTFVLISWDPFTVPFYEYRLYRDTSATGSFSNLIYRGTANWHLDKNLQCGNYYKVSVVNSCYNASLKSNYLTYSLMPSVPRPTAKGISEAVKISWGAVSVSVTTLYSVYKDTSAAGSFTQAVYSGPDTSYTDTAADMICGTMHYYKVLAENSCGKSEKSNYVSAGIAPSPSIEFRVPSGATTSDELLCGINWLSTTGATGYKLYKDTSETGSFTQEIYSGSGTSYTDKIPWQPSGTIYYYKVLAENSCGRSLTGVLRIYILDQKQWKCTLALPLWHKIE